MQIDGCNTKYFRVRTTTVTFCVINFNGEKYLEATLNSIIAQLHDSDEVILVDNCSTDRSLEIAKHQFGQVKVIPMARNLGPGAARNAGFHAALNDWILFLDNDVSLTPCCLDRLIAALEQHPAAVAAMPRVIYADNPDIIQYDGADTHYLGLMLLHSSDMPAHRGTTSIKKLSSIVSACMLLKRKDWKYPELFDEFIFIYFDDHDFGIKAQVLGHDLLAVPDATVLHSKGTTGLSLRAKGKYAKARIFNLIKNRWLLIFKYYQPRTLAILLPIILLYEMAQIIAMIRKGWFSQWLASAKWILSNIASIQAKRKMIQQSRIRQDREVLKGGHLPFTSYLATGQLERFGIKLLDMVTSIYWQAVRKLI